MLYADVCKLLYIMLLCFEKEDYTMANTATVYARIDPELKNDVDDILKTLGMTPSSLIQMLYSEIRLTKKVPLSLAIPRSKPLSAASLKKEEFDKEMQKGLDDMNSGRVHSLEEVDSILKKELKI